MPFLTDINRFILTFTCICGLNTLVALKDGFEFWNDYGRSGFISTFAYNKKEKKMQLVKMKQTNYEISGTYSGENGGTSVVDLLTNKYTAHFRVLRNKKMVELPAINRIMVFLKPTCKPLVMILISIMRKNVWPFIISTRQKINSIRNLKE